VLRTGRVGSTSHRKLHLARIDLNGVVEECLQRASVLHRVPAGAIDYQPGPPVTILGDPDEVRAAVSNLIDNAVKYSGNPVKVKVEIDPAEDKYVSLRVRDQGVGIPKMELKQIFKRFYRVPGPLSMRVKGTGLGLYIVRSVAKRHGGRAWAESEGLGHGSTFILKLPIVK
jgi:signal transduction histidine kinase